MPRTSRVAPGGMVFHVLNRGVGRMALFRRAADYAAFEAIMPETLTKEPMRICSYCLMPNHWHMVLWPQRDGELAAFLQRLTLTHATRWQRNRRCVGQGHVYQGRFKSFPVSDDDHLYQVVRYVERNAQRAGLAVRAEAWRWSSLWRRLEGTPDQQSLLSDWPIPRPERWTDYVNAILSASLSLCNTTTPHCHTVRLTFNMRPGLMGYRKHLHRNRSRTHKMLSV